MLVRGQIICLAVYSPQVVGSIVTSGSRYWSISRNYWTFRAEINIASNSASQNHKANQKVDMAGITLKKDEKAELRAKGVCFCWKQLGHIVVACANKTKKYTEAHMPATRACFM
ncbi:MAG: hypothetical protein BJ554DRAFT_6508 [Olpidium bornovanus]|uniref:Uncharacterized protein n=1 Tax=Olpidium bornovanus TaxID=278681 RepID=A0A8H8DK64_9FUNG|nr:MAG: hypothetical protein BJ554DRAFT_6508 [Olpidium bornovanus]